MIPYRADNSTLQPVSDGRDLWGYHVKVLDSWGPFRIKVCVRLCVWVRVCVWVWPTGVFVSV